ncbi:MAG: chaperone modulator CbpM [Pseudoxanthomonas suwonensis]|nr:chaperone modulator CbpM [Pseudoxanthomonas suwonensis]
MKTVELQVFLDEARIELRTLEQWVAQRWVVPAETEQLELSETDCARILLIRELKGDFGVNDEGVDLVLHLLDQLHGMRALVASLRGELQAQDD